MRWEVDVSLALHTRYRIGGPAARFARPASMADLREALREIGYGEHDTLGWGANILVADRGVPSCVFALGGDFDFVNLDEDGLEAGAAAGLPGLIGEARRAGRSGFAFLEAVPGTVGGGLRMNAGSATVGLWDRVEWVEAMTPEGEVVRLTPGDAAPTYRSVDVPESWVFTRARFAAPAGDPGVINEEHFARRRMKTESQVYELPSCGSTWKNPGPPNGSAWEVVDRVNMRGARKGGARIAEKHANFIVNEGQATAADVLWLMQETRRRVHEELGCWLEAEIRLWGFDAPDLESVGAKP